MTEPGDVRADDVDHVAVLVISLTRYHVREHALGFSAAQQDTLHDPTLDSVLEEVLLAFLGIWVLQLLPELESTLRDEEVVDANDGDSVLLTLSCTLLAQTASHVAEFAPRSVRPVCASVLFAFGSTWHGRNDRLPERGGFTVLFDDLLHIRDVLVDLVEDVALLPHFSLLLDFLLTLAMLLGSRSNQTLVATVRLTDLVLQ